MVVQALPSLQLNVVPWHCPDLQVSLLVHLLPSSQDPPDTGANTHWPPLEQLSLVQGLPSVQVLGVPLHWPDWQLSPVVQASPSLQAAPELGVKVHPVENEQLSLVQGLPSVHASWAPPTHLPDWHVSLVVHLLPSSQLEPELLKVQPIGPASGAAVSGVPVSGEPVSG